MCHRCCVEYPGDNKKKVVTNILQFVSFVPTTRMTFLREYKIATPTNEALKGITFQTQRHINGAHSI